MRRLRAWRPHLPTRFDDLMIIRRTVLFAIPLVALAVLVIAFTLPQPLTMVAASARAETLDIQVHNPDEASFVLPRARIGQYGPCRANVTVQPDQGSTVNYTRPVGAPLVVAVKGRSSWRNRTMLLGQKTRPGDVAVFWVDPHDRTCAGAGYVRLPIAGALTVGTLSASGGGGDRPMPILSGDLKVYGRAVDSLFFGIVPLGWLQRLTNAGPGTLYVAESIMLPPGSQLGHAFTDVSDIPPFARWWGFVDANMSDGGTDRGMWIEASTNASTLELIAPAPRPLAGRSSHGANVGEPDIISLTLAARLVGDPNLRWLFAIISFIIVVIGVEAQLFSLPSPKRPP
jgi:hypothetical protein